MTNLQMSKRKLNYRKMAFFFIKNNDDRNCNKDTNLLVVLI